MPKTKQKYLDKKKEYLKKNHEEINRKRKLYRATEKHKLQQKKWRADNTDKIKTYHSNWRNNHREDFNKCVRKSYMKAFYKITPEYYEELLKKQKRTCALCSNTDELRRLHIDHDHKTGRVRGLLCFTCNTGLGKLKDDITILKRAILYLSK